MLAFEQKDTFVSFRVYEFRNFFPQCFINDFVERVATCCLRTFSMPLSA